MKPERHELENPPGRHLKQVFFYFSTFNVQRRLDPKPKNCFGAEIGAFPIPAADNPPGVRLSPAEARVHVKPSWLSLV